MQGAKLEKKISPKTRKILKTCWNFVCEMSTDHLFETPALKYSRLMHSSSYSILYHKIMTQFSFLMNLYSSYAVFFSHGQFNPTIWKCRCADVQKSLPCFETCWTKKSYNLCLKSLFLYQSKMPSKTSEALVVLSSAYLTRELILAELNSEKLFEQNCRSTFRS